MCSKQRKPKKRKYIVEVYVACESSTVDFSEIRKNSIIDVPERLESRKRVLYPGAIGGGQNQPQVFQ